MIETPDAALLERLARETGAEQKLVQPGFDEYAVAVAEAFTEWLVATVTPVGRFVAAHPVALELLARLLLVALVIALGLALLRALRQRKGGQASPPAALAPAAPRVLERDRAAWRAQVEARLSAGDVPAALEAAWWWFARSLLGPRAREFQTTRELLGHANRAELTPLVDALDRLLYAPERPRPADLRAWLQRADGALA